MEESDIVDTRERGGVQVEFAGGSIVNLVGGTFYIVPAGPKVKPGATTLFISRGWAKAVAKAPGVRLRAASAEVGIATGAVVAQTDGTRLDAFVEAGGARLATLGPLGSALGTQDAKQDEYWSKSAARRVRASARPPRTFVDAMPRHFADPLPSFAGKFVTRPELAADGEVSYAEAQPWLAGSDRAVFERRFASRLADPVFRKAVEPDVARYPSWDRAASGKICTAGWSQPLTLPCAVQRSRRSERRIYHEADLEVQPRPAGDLRARVPHRGLYLVHGPAEERA